MHCKHPLLLRRVLIWLECDIWQGTASTPGNTCGLGVLHVAQSVKNLRQVRHKVVNFVLMQR
jgi:hypothetical protein